MDNLTPEILSLILAQVYADTPLVPRFASNGIPRTTLATVSHKWQALVEPRAFSRIKLWLTDAELSTFTNVFRSPRRRNLLRRLSLRSLELSFSCYQRRKTPSRRYLTLTNLEPGPDLPSVPCITALNIRTGKSRALHPSSICKLASHLPNLQTLTLHIKTPAPSRPALRKSLRKALAEGLESLTLPSLRRLELIQSPALEIYAHSFPCSDLCNPDGTDPLNTAIRHFAQRTPLTTLILTDIMISPDLFTSSNDPTPCMWPTLHVFAIEATALAPSGEWYWTSDPSATRAWTPPEFQDDGYPDIPRPADDSNSESESDFDADADAERNGYEPKYEWRDTPDDAMLTPLLVAMADAVGRMPNLRSGSLYLEHGMEFRGGCTEIAISCAEVGERFVRSWDEDGEEDGRG
ncbi:hypothetical protein B0T19DRAFT_478708 [Cercophora scortea]|uniref:F-box domain-containing protein n=1 Tax=Cercophora scortea TaxID=314031 RepID=A0AAE0I7I3_9PEZI|nr:hypothetical protein B0T19DRAFT_478708 [Cercophora scortea]